MCGFCSMTPASTLWPHPIRPATWNQTPKTNPASTLSGGLMTPINSRALSLQLQLEAAKVRIADLEAVIDQKDDDIVDLIDQLGRLNRELEDLRADTWRPHH